MGEGACSTTEHWRTRLVAFKKDDFGSINNRFTVSVRGLMSLL